MYWQFLICRLYVDKYGAPTVHWYIDILTDHQLVTLIYRLVSGYIVDQIIMLYIPEKLTKYYR